MRRGRWPRQMLQHRAWPFALWIWLLACPALAFGQDTEPVTVTYIANEGVLISQGDTQVLIDALHNPYRPVYLHTPRALLDRMMQGTAPFTSVDVMLVSHIHRDHFDGALVAGYLQRQPEVTLFAAPQVVDSVLTYVPTSAQATTRIKQATYQTGTTSSFAAGDAQITLGKIAHGSQRWHWIQNVGHIVEVGGLRFLHIGDPAYGEADFEALNILDANIDVAILPSWFLTETRGQRVIQDHIQPNALIAVHVSPAQAAEVTAKVARFYPDAKVFTTPLQAVHFEPPSN